MTVPPRVDHGLARLAADTLDKVRDQQTRTVPDQVITRLKELPALLRTSGPLAVLAFYAAKAGGRTTVARAYAAVGGALRDQAAAGLSQTVPADASFGQFVRALTGQAISPDELARMSARLEAFALWLRRLAEAVEQEQEQAKRQAARAGGAGTEDSTGSGPGSLPDGAGRA
jgi:hypothetical protein